MRREKVEIVNIIFDTRAKNNKEIKFNILFNLHPQPL